MRYTYAQALEAGGVLAEAARRLMGERRPAPAAREGGPRPRSRGTPNQLERRLWDELLRVPEIREVRFEAIRLKLAGHTWYYPDFLVQFRDGRRPAIVEAKGHLEDDSAVKLKTAASLYPEFDWYLVVARQGGYDVREVTDRGIGRVRVAVAWIPGSG